MLIVEIALGVTLGSILTEVIASIVVVVRKKRALKTQEAEREEYMARLADLAAKFEYTSPGVVDEDAPTADDQA